MSEKFNRTKLLIGEEGFEILKSLNIAILGIGGVGSFTAEALGRAGIGKLTLIDHDIVDITNINRQIHALTSTVGQIKVEIMKKRLKDINPEAQITAIREFCTPDNINELLKEEYDYIVDAIDNVTGKLSIIEYAVKKQIPVISSMGAANKLSNKNFQVVDISQTRVCPLAKVIRKELRARGIDKGVKVVYSPDPIIKPDKIKLENNSGKRELPGSISFVPPVAGLIMAGEVINDLLHKIN
ncbi:MAG: tRNA threonylcarbamoyladenosine dehydratase [Clostridia bacterium]|jgi:tRNA A37 threonylcarbamoyladenosine dehydratase|nr:tRNA threonylcarbamoyladenosine dehydratase [Clostridia bacterium]MDN5323187.1 tRNA threonylcarbamoyladenosine dehydratase [Clostridia bacterium]